MAITIVDDEQSALGNALPPATTAEDDVLVAFVVNNTLSIPSNASWTLRGSERITFSGGVIRSVHALTRTAGASEPSLYAITNAETVRTVGLRGADESKLRFASEHYSGSTLVTMPSLTVAADDLYLACCAVVGAGAQVTPPSLLTELVDGVITVTHSQISYRTMSASGASTVGASRLSGYDYPPRVVIAALGIGVLNRPPSGPTVQLNGVSSGLADLTTATLTLGLNDPDDDDTRSATAIEVIEDGGTPQYIHLAAGTLEASEVKNATTESEFDVTGLLVNGSAWQVRAKDWDAADTEGAYSGYITVTGNNRPVITVTAPAGVVDDTTFVTVEVSYVDAEGDPQESWQAVITPAVYADGVEAASLSAPRIAENVADSRVSFGEHTSWTAPALPNQQSYVAWWRSWQTGGLSHSDWAFSEFSIDLEPPDPPQVTVTPDNVNNINHVTVISPINLLSEDDSEYTTGVGTWTAETGATVADTGTTPNRKLKVTAQ